MFYLLNIFLFSTFNNYKKLCDTDLQNGAIDTASQSKELIIIFIFDCNITDCLNLERNGKILLSKDFIARSLSFGKQSLVNIIIFHLGL